MTTLKKALFDAEAQKKRAIEIVELFNTAISTEKDIVEYTKKLEDLNNEIKEAEETVSKWEKRVADVRASLSQEERSFAETKAVKKKELADINREVKEEVDKARKQKEAAISGLDAEVIRLTNEKKALEGDIDTLKSTISRISSNLSSVG